MLIFALVALFALVPLCSPFGSQVVIDAFRTINPQLMMLGHAPRQTTSNLGHLRKPSIAALIHNLNRHYYSINIGYRKNELEQKMLLNLHKKNWTDGLTVKSAVAHASENEAALKSMLELAKSYNKRLEDAEGKSAEELLQQSVGKMDPKRHLEMQVEELATRNINQTLGLMLSTVAF